MKQLINFSREIFYDEEGVTMIEYALIAAMIAMVVVATLLLIGSNLKTLYERVRDCITGLSNEACD